LYDFEINAQRVGDYELAPGWTEYNKRVQYQPTM
jgi:alpha-L-rhamnosidase